MYSIVEKYWLLPITNHHNKKFDNLNDLLLIIYYDFSFSLELYIYFKVKIDKIKNF